MLVTNHVLSGAVIGAAARRPIPAFFLGVGRRFFLVAVPDGLVGLADRAGFMLISAPRSN
jgi:hypothetical protein